MMNKTEIKLFKSAVNEFKESFSNIAFRAYEPKCAFRDCIKAGNATLKTFSYCDKSVFTIITDNNESNIHWNIDIAGMEEMHDIWFDEDYKSKDTHYEMEQSL